MLLSSKYVRLVLLEDVIARNIKKKTHINKILNNLPRFLMDKNWSQILHLDIIPYNLDLPSQMRDDYFQTSG